VAALLTGFERLGFTRDPFSHAEAEVELTLPEYYIKPPYYADILGDAENQKSWIIFGDFGRGKSALRRQIYSDLRNDPSDKIVCVTYDDFTGLVENKGIEDVTLADHLDQIMMRLVLAFLALVAKRKSQVKLNQVQRQNAQWFTRKYFRTLSRAEAEVFLDSVSTIDDRTRRLIREQKGAITNVIVNVALGYFGLPTIKVDLPSEEDSESVPVGSSYLLLQKLYDLYSLFGVRSLIVLVDRVDQSKQELSDPVNVVKFLKELLWNYNILGLQEAGVHRQVLGFKFFLPFENETKEELNKKKFRFERVLPKNISWTDAMLRTIWRKRLAYFSDNRILDLAVVCDDTRIDATILARSNGIPRRMLLMGRYVLLEYNNLVDQPRKIPMECVERGLRNFEKEFG
jgi:hypothetical protein